MNGPLRVLIVEDCEDDAVLMVRVLTRAGCAPTWERVFTRAGMRAALDRQGWDLVLSDHNMPQFSAPEALSVLQERDMGVPFIVVSGAPREGFADALLEAGGADCVCKDDLSALVPAVERALRR